MKEPLPVKQGCCKCKPTTAKSYAYWSAAFALLTAVGIVATTVVHDAIKNAMESGIAAVFILDSPSAQDFGPWSSSLDPNAAVIFTAFYVYNITNPEEVLAGGKPNVTELGPLTYNYMQQKFNISWDPEQLGEVVSFQKWQYYTPADELTQQLEQQVITSLNMPLLGTLHNSFTTSSGVTEVGALLAIDGLGWTAPSALFVQRPIKEIIWGYEDPLLAALHGLDASIPTYYPGFQGNDTSLAEAAQKHPFNSIYTGKNSGQLARQYIQWEGTDSLQCCSFGVCTDPGAGGFPVSPWGTPEANRIQGAFGDQFFQNVDHSSQLQVSSHAFGIYRSWPLEAVQGGDYEVSGISLIRFQQAAGTLGNASVNPEEALAYNVNGPSGLLNQSSCEWGAKVFISNPRFYLASDSLREGVNGLLPANEQQHGTWLGVEPNTGSTLDFHWRVAINALIEPDALAGTSFFQGVQQTYMPLVWADRYGSATASQASAFHRKVGFALTMQAATRWGGIAIAGLAFLLTAGFAWKARKLHTQQEQQREAAASAYYAEVFKPFLSQDALSAAQAQMAAGQYVPGYTVLSEALITGAAAPLNSPPPLMVGAAGSAGASGGNGRPSFSLNSSGAGAGSGRGIVVPEARASFSASMVSGAGHLSDPFGDRAGGGGGAGGHERGSLKGVALGNLSSDSFAGVSGKGAV